MVSGNSFRLAIFGDHGLHHGPGGDHTLLIRRDPNPVSLHERDHYLPRALVYPSHPPIVATGADAKHLPIPDIAGPHDKYEVGAVRVGGGTQRLEILHRAGDEAARPTGVDVLLRQMALRSAGPVDATEDAVRRLFPGARSMSVQPGPSYFCASSPHFDLGPLDRHWPRRARA
jgi:hypothetical protein